MTSPRNISPAFHPHHHGRQEDEHLLSHSSRLESASLESNRTDLSLNSRNVVVAETWLVLGKIGEGSFGEVFEVRDLNTQRHYAIKRETQKIKHPQLKFENVMYDVLAGGVGIPQCHWYGQFDGFDCIVMDLLGPNLGQVRENVSCMELDIAVDLVCQMVSIVEHIHHRGVLVRDVKPDNFLFPSSCYLPEMEMVESVDDYDMPVTTYKKATCKQVFEEQWGETYPRLYAVDFGLACYWRDPETGIPYHDEAKKRNRSKTGTARYASINVHRGKSHSRRDDVESIGYILLDLLLGTLPWTGISARNSKMGWDRMRQMKMDTNLTDLCAGLPVGVLHFVEYPRHLQFFDQPDYEQMRHYLKECLPGGAYSKSVKPQFGGEAQPTDNYNIVQYEPEQLQQKQQRYYRQPNSDKVEHGAPSNDDNQAGMFAMEDLTNQLSITALSEPKKPAHQQRKNSEVSTSALHKLMKRHRSQKEGWNTHKHDEASWNPRTNWTKEEQSTDNNKLVQSWTNDNPDRLSAATNRGLSTLTDMETAQNTDDDDLDFVRSRNKHHTAGHGGDNGYQYIPRRYNSTAFVARHSDPAIASMYSQSTSDMSQNRSYQDSRPFLTETPTYLQQQQQRYYSQPHGHRRYSNPPKPTTGQRQRHNSDNSRRRYHAAEGDQQSQYSPTADMYGYYRRSSHHRNSSNINSSLQEATGMDNWSKKDERKISWQQQHHPGPQ